MLLEPLGEDKIGLACVSGVVPAYVRIYDEKDHYAAARPSPGAPIGSLRSCRGGGNATILWKPSGTGYKWCAVQMGTVVALDCQGTAVLAVATTDATFSVRNVYPRNGRNPTTLPTDWLTVSNLHSLECLGGDPVSFRWSRYAEAWQAYQMG